MNFDLRGAVPGLLLTALAWVFSGCGGSSPAELPNAGKSMLFTPGVLAFDIECLPVIDGTATAVDVYYGIPASSLTFFKTGTGFQAVYEVTLRAWDEKKTDLLNENSWPETTFVATYPETQRPDPIEHVRRLTLPPGRHLVEAHLEQTYDRTATVRMQRVEIPQPLSAVPVASRLFIRWRVPGGYIAPFVFFHIPSGLDSLEAAATFFHLPLGRETIMEFVFEHFRYDTTVPRAPYLYSSVIQFQRTYSFDDRNAFDTVLTGSASLFPSAARTTAVFMLPKGAPGIYRISVHARVPGSGSLAGDTVLSMRRIISIKGETFPRPSTLDELIGPLTYIATKDEMEHIRSSRTEAEKRERFDLFWLARTGDRTAAANLIREYYTRVMDANRYFSTVKEGWQTDMGMVYIVLGPPPAATHAFEGEVWQYTFPGSAGTTSFSFRAISILGEGVSLTDYLLSRDAIYEDPWTRQVSHWRRGESY